MKVYRNIYLKYYDSLPRELMQGKATLFYSGRLVFRYRNTPPTFDRTRDLEITCDCDLGELQDIRRQPQN